MKSVVVNYLTEFFGERKIYAAIYILLSFSSPIGEVVLPYYYGKLIQGIADKTPITKYLIIVAVLWILVQVMYSLMDKLDCKIVPDMQSFLRTKIVDEIFAKHIHQNDDMQVGKVIDRLTKLPIIITDLFVEARYYILPAIYVMIFANGYFFFVNVTLGLVTLMILAVFVGILFAFRNAFHNSEMSVKQSELSEEISDILENLNNVYAHGTVENEKSRILEKHKELKDATRRTYQKANRLKIMLNVFYAITFLTINGYAYYLYTRGTIELSSLSSVFIIVLYMINQFVTLSGEITSIIQNMSIVDEVHEYISSMNDMFHSSNDDDAQPQVLVKVLNGEIVLREISYSIDGKVIFDSLNLSFPERSKTCLFGRIGSGKTTLINIIMGYVLPQSGHVLFDGHSLPPRIIRDNISYVRQNHRLFNRTLLENIVYGCSSNITVTAVENLMTSHGLNSVFGNHSLMDKIGKNGCHLSGGQRQIIVLLRAALRDRPIVILDEPTSAMDEDMREMIVNFSKTAFAEKTVIFITHDSNIRRTYGFDRIIDVGTLRSCE